MTWHKHELLFRLLAPLHIGHRKVSNLQQTRAYVPGKVFWAALTARLTRDYDDGSDGQCYEEIGQQVERKFRFGYLYPALQSDGGYFPVYPWQDGFDYLFIDSYASAALDYAGKSAADGLLHETEFIAPHTRCGQPVYLTGSVYVKTQLPAPLQEWKQILDRLQFGGERGYGWGRVHLIRLSDPTVNEPVVTINSNCCVYAHVAAHPTPKNRLIGAVEPLLGWERNNSGGSRWRLTPQTQICYAPGSVVSQRTTFKIGPKGIWQQEQQDD